MAVYGRGRQGVTFSGFSPILGVGNEPTETTGYVLKNGMGQQDIKFNRMLRQNKNIIYRELLNALIGTAPGGGTANVGRYIILGNPLLNTGANFDGVEGIGQLPLINRVTTVADQTNFNTMFNGTRGPASYPTDVSGNGGGNKAGW